MNHPYKIFFVCLISISFTHIMSWQVDSLFRELGYPQKAIEKRIKGYSANAPFSIESQLLVEMVNDNEMFARAHEKNLVPKEAFLLKEAIIAIENYNEKTISQKNNFFSYPLVVEAYIFGVGKNPGTEMRRRGAASILLHLAIRENAPVETVELILSRGADINKVDGNGDTALMLAASRGRADIVARLLVSGADFNMVNEQGQTVFSIALVHGDQDIIEALLNRGACIGRFEKGEDVALRLVIEKSIADAPKYGDIVAFLIKRGANVNHVIEGVTPLMAAVQDNNVYIAQVLLKHGAQVDMVVEGVSPLRFAFLHDYLDMFKLLLNHGADINFCDNGETIFHTVVKQRNASLARELLHAGATPNTVNASGWTPLADAAALGYVDMVQLILKNDGWKLANFKVNGKLPQDLAREKGYINIFGMLGGYY